MEDKKCTSFNISTFTIIKIILVFILFYFLYLIREILAILFVSLILASAVDPWVDWMEKRKIPRGAGILVIYLVMFAVVGGVVGLIIPPIIEQTNDLIESFPRIFEKIVSAFSILKEYSIKHGLLDEIRNSFEKNSLVRCSCSAPSLYHETCKQDAKKGWIVASWPTYSFFNYIPAYLLRFTFVGCKVCLGFGVDCWLNRICALFGANNCFYSSHIFVIYSGANTCCFCGNCLLYYSISGKQYYCSQVDAKSGRTKPNSEYCCFNDRI